MGLFGKKDHNISNETEAFFAVIFACIAVDGKITVEEMHDVTSIFQKSHIFGDIDLNAHYDKIKKLYKECDNCELLIELAAPHLSESIKPTVYANVMDMVFADGIFDKPEQALVEKLKKELEISEELDKRITEVILIKNKWEQ